MIIFNILVFVLQVVTCSNDSNYLDYDDAALDETYTDGMGWNSGEEGSNGILEIYVHPNTTFLNINHCLPIKTLVKPYDQSGLFELSVAMKLNMEFWKSGQPIKILVHGFNENTTFRQAEIYESIFPNLIALGNEFVSADNNVIYLDWTKAAFDYDEAIENLPWIGACFREILLNLYKDTFYQRLGIQSKDIHIIGFSLGAHIAGLSRFPGTRIIGLDPIGPNFRNCYSQREASTYANICKHILAVGENLAIDPISPG